MYDPTTAYHVAIAMHEDRMRGLKRTRRPARHASGLLAQHIRAFPGRRIQKAEARAVCARHNSPA